MRYTINLGGDPFGLHYSGPGFSLDRKRYGMIGVITWDYGCGQKEKGVLAKDLKRGGYVMLRGLFVKRLEKRRIEALMRTPQRRGPKKKLEGGKKRQIWVSDANYAWLKQIGQGNVRLGLSLYLDAKDKFEGKSK